MPKDFQSNPKRTSKRKTQNEVVQKQTQVVREDLGLIHAWLRQDLGMIKDDSIMFQSASSMIWTCTQYDLDMI